jgi:hypothetical protein
MAFKEGPPILQAYYIPIGQPTGYIDNYKFPSLPEKGDKEMGAIGDNAIYSHVIIPREPKTDVVSHRAPIPNSSGLETRVIHEGRSFKVSLSLKNWLNRYGYEPNGLESRSAIRVFNKGQFGDTAGSYYFVKELEFITYNRTDNKRVLGDAFVKTQPTLSQMDRLLEAFEKVSLVHEEFAIPFLRYRNGDNTIWYLPNAQRILTAEYNPVVITPRQLYPITDARLYERYASDTSGISIQTRAQLSQIEADIRNQHTIENINHFAQNIAASATPQKAL